MKDRNQRYSRTIGMIGQSGQEKLWQANVCLFGVGGVGGFACEALVRAGIGAITLVDPDPVQESNLNRQIIADYETLGEPKTQVMARRIGRINPECQVTCRELFYLPDCPESQALDFRQFDYVIDAIDTVASKIDILRRCYELGVPVISSMGMGNKLDNRHIQVADISKTSVCPLAKAVRRDLRKVGITKGVKAVFSTEEPVCQARPPGSISYVPSTAGLILAGEVIRDLLKS